MLVGNLNLRDGHRDEEDGIATQCRIGLGTSRKGYKGQERVSTMELRPLSLEKPIWKFAGIWEFDFQNVFSITNLLCLDYLWESLEASENSVYEFLRFPSVCTHKGI